MNSNKTMWRFFFLLILGLIAQFSKAQSDYYWVGGSGNWSDLNHWATTSGGATLYTELPTASDDVFFDENSFATADEVVFMDVASIDVRNMDWRGSNDPKFLPSAGVFNTLTVYGSLYLHEGMEANFRSLSFRPQDGILQTFKTGGLNLGNVNVGFNCLDGGISVQDSLVANRLSFINMFYDLDFNGNPIHTLNTIDFRLPVNKTIDMSGCNVYTRSLSMRAFVTEPDGLIDTEGATLHIIYANGTTQIDRSKYDQPLFSNTIITEDHRIANFNAVIDQITLDKGVQLTIDPIIDSVEVANLVSLGTPEERVTIKSSTEGESASIYVASGTIEIEHANLQDIRAYGGATFNARASQDLGNVTGWNFIKEDQTIQFEEIDSKTYADVDETFELVGSASSGLQLTYESSNSDVAVINGSNQLVIKGVGTAEITASQAGNDLFNQAPPVTRTLEVLKAEQAIQFEAMEDTWVGEESIVLVSSSSSGLPVSYSVTGPATIEGSTLTFTGVGLIEVTATQAGNESFLEASPVVRSFSTFKRDQAITFDALADQWVGEETLTLAATSDAGLLVSYTVTGPASLAGNVLTLTGVGAIEVTANQPGNDNYHPATSVIHSFNTFKRAQEITFDEIVDRWIGDESLELAATSDAGLPIDYAVTGPASLAGNVLTMTGIGTVEVTASQAGDAYYLEATAVSQSFSTFKRSQELAFGSLVDAWVGEETVILEATSSQNLPISYRVTGPASISENVLTIAGEGTIEVTASQPGNDLYLEAEQITQAFEAFKREQQITFAALDDVLLSQGTVTLGATSSSGLAIEYTVSGPASMEGNTLTILDEGTVTVTASQAGDHRYLEASVVQQTFEVSLPLGVDHRASVKVFPNPFVDHIQIEGVSSGSYNIFDRMGRRVKNGQIENRAVELTTLPSGRYFIVLESKNLKETHHLIKR